MVCTDSYYCQLIHGEVWPHKVQFTLALSQESQAFACRSSTTRETSPVQGRIAAAGRTLGLKEVEHADGAVKSIGIHQDAQDQERRTACRRAEADGSDARFQAGGEVSPPTHQRHIRQDDLRAADEEGREPKERGDAKLVFETHVFEIEKDET
jgi:hypothetical protein